ncbi:unnamed protein product [Fusarium graminearum]|uniref:Chromosome 1, complete genome n=1 Tax=Gibberella zeae (strain ATCC MYA-4620 / CBS 123657 / FGSC 9075 / NRRL 31084 / PH-1) TaxID=229533 RepID=I1SA00_GIBZE|nr:hypothetical protein FGSG_13681 [Fusarium graminearum PH-1]ESU16646.1 hypothetical protein FGSG_13681 [Fusarium graminearum PH-1]CEF75310.1 unnamed protein product [Fusarium graminearum]CZS78590.1 unnamed protein product [Fusarium graminearum]|eukprot:XP_011318908.1 hypothetical protein FGSG_13681 [Fusarium graminearum PH-1]
MDLMQALSPCLMVSTPGFTSFAVPPLDLRKSIFCSSWFLNEIKTANAIASRPEEHCAVTCLHDLTVCFTNTVIAPHPVVALTDIFETGSRVIFAESLSTCALRCISCTVRHQLSLKRNGCW